MKCEVCLSLLEEFVDRELAESDAGEVSAHLITCAECSTEFAALTAEQELFARYDREIEVPASLWQTVAARTEPASEVVAAGLSGTGLRARLAGFFTPSFGFSFAGALALLVVALLVGSVYLGTRSSGKEETAVKKGNGVSNQADNKAPEIRPENNEPPAPNDSQKVIAQKPLKTRSRQSIRSGKFNANNQSDVLSSDSGYADMDDQETAKHIEQSQNLLRSIRNVQVTDNDDDIDVTYDKALSRRLLSENIILRRDAEAKAQFPTKTLLSDLEPFLIDIANLPDKASSDEVRTIKERVQKTEIVAALVGFQGEARGNR